MPLALCVRLVSLSLCMYMRLCMRASRQADAGAFPNWLVIDFWFSWFTFVCLHWRTGMVGVTHRSVGVSRQNEMRCSGWFFLLGLVLWVDVSILALFIYFTSAAVAVDSSRMTASSSASWSRFSSLSYLVNVRVSSMRFMVCRWQKSQDCNWARRN